MWRSILRRKSCWRTASVQQRSSPIVAHLESIGGTCEIAVCYLTWLESVRKDRESVGIIVFGQPALYDYRINP